MWRSDRALPWATAEAGLIELLSESKGNEIAAVGSDWHDHWNDRCEISEIEWKAINPRRELRKTDDKFISNSTI